MRGRASVVVATLLSVQAICAFADNCVFPPNPVGEALYREQLHRELPLPMGVIVAAFLGAWVVHKFGRKRRTDDQNDPTGLAGQTYAHSSDAPRPADTSDTNEAQGKEFGGYGAPEALFSLAPAGPASCSY